MAVSEKGSILNSTGVYGGKYISTTSAITPDTGYVFFAIQVISDAVVTCIGNITGLTSISIGAGTIFYGKFTSITLTSGTVIAYHGI
jgi:hypothetical protein